MGLQLVERALELSSLGVAGGELSRRGSLVVEDRREQAVGRVVAGSAGILDLVVDDSDCHPSWRRSARA